MVILARGSQWTVKVTSDHVLLVKENMAFKLAILCAVFGFWLRERTFHRNEALRRKMKRLDG